MAGAVGVLGAVGWVILGGIISAAAAQDGESDGLPLARAAFFNAQGTLVIYDAAIGESPSPARGEGPSAFIAYWHDYATDETYFYEHLLTNQRQLHAAIASLEQNFSPGLADGSRLNARAKGDWHEATAQALYALMRLSGEPPAFGPVSVIAADCPPYGCEELQSPDMPGADGMSTPAGPGEDASYEDFVSGALLALDCCGGGGGDPPGPTCYGCCCCPRLEAAAKLAEFEGLVIAAAGCCPTLACDDGDPCTLYDRCGGYSGIPCGAAECCGALKDCDDDNPCTGDICASQTGTCLNAWLCDDGYPCTIDSCDGDGCTHVAKDCDDDDPCTYDDCDFYSGACEHVEFCNYECCDWAGGPSCCTATQTECCEDGCCDGVCCNGACCLDDGDLCTIEQCGSGGACLHVPFVCPPDGNECTDDVCDHGECYYDPLPAGTTCDDEPDPCTFDICDSNGECTHPCKTDCILCSGGQVAGEQDGFCIDCACYPESCDIEVTDGITCPGGAAEVTVSGGCLPECITEMNWEITSTSPYITGTSDTLSCAGKSRIAMVEVSPDAPLGQIPITIIGTTPGGGQCSNLAALTVVQADVAFDEVAEEQEEAPGGLLCINGDDDNDDGLPDKDAPGPTAGENDLVPLVLSVPPALAGTATLSCTGACAKVAVYNNADRTGPVTLPQTWLVPGTPFPVVLYAEGVAASAALRDVELQVVTSGNMQPCEDRVRLTVIQPEMDLITYGVDPLPLNPAVVAPLRTILDDGTIFEDFNTFAFTSMEPDIDLSPFPVEWALAMIDGTVTSQVDLIPANDRRSVQVWMPNPSNLNFGTAEVAFIASCRECAVARTLIRNIQPDLEPGDFRFPIRAHLCTDGSGTATSRTATEIQTLMADVTKVLSQCGIIVAIGDIVTSTVPTPEVANLVPGQLTVSLFAYDPHDQHIDVYFVVQIEGGNTRGLTKTPEASGPLFEAGVAIADRSAEGLLQGQEAVRVIAHEITHYLLNHPPSVDDHRASIRNLMPSATNSSSRDLDEGQCLELRSNYGVD